MDVEGKGREGCSKVVFIITLHSNDGLVSFHLRQAQALLQEPLPFMLTSFLIYSHQSAIAQGDTLTNLTVTQCRVLKKGESWRKMTDNEYNSHYWNTLRRTQMTFGTIPPRNPEWSWSSHDPFYLETIVVRTWGRGGA
jgi:hypothetical protein